MHSVAKLLNHINANIINRITGAIKHWARGSSKAAYGEHLNESCMSCLNIVFQISHWALNKSSVWLASQVFRQSS